MNLSMEEPHKSWARHNCLFSKQSQRSQLNFFSRKKNSKILVVKMIWSAHAGLWVAQSTFETKIWVPFQGLFDLMA